MFNGREAMRHQPTAAHHRQLVYYLVRIWPSLSLSNTLLTTSMVGRSSGRLDKH